MKNPYYLCIYITLLGLGLSGPLQAQTEVYLRAESRYFTRLPVLLKPAEVNKEAGEQLGKEIVNILDTDLWYSSVIDPKQPGVDLVGAWTGKRGQNAGAEALRFAVETRVTRSGERLRLEVRVIDQTNGKPVAEKSYDSCMDKMRFTVHTLADEVVTLLTGEKGIAKSRVAFTSRLEKSKEIFIVDYDGHNRQTITRNRSLNLTPAWSTDGRRLVVTSYLKDNPDLHLLEPSSGTMSLLLAGKGLNTSPVMSPDGKLIAFVSTRDGNAEIYTIDTRGGSLRRLTHHGSIDSAPDWSPSGREIVFSSDRLGNPQLFIMDAEGSNLRRIETGLDYCDSPDWSPRGDKIAFVSRQDGVFDIFTWDIVGRSSTRLTEKTGSNEDPSWSPDGFQLAFSSTREKGRDIYTMNWDGSQVLRLTFLENCTSPAWSPNERPGESIACQ